MDAFKESTEEEKKHILADPNQMKIEDDEEENSNRSSLPAASFNYVNSIVGSGIIGMAYALNQAGILVGLILIIGLGLVTDYSLVILIQASRISGTQSYQGVMNAAFGTTGYVILSLLQFIYPFIAMVSYNVIVGDTVTKVLVYYAGMESGDSLWSRREFVISVTTLLVSLPLALHDGMAKFARISLISLVVTGFVLCTIIIRLFTLGPFVPPSSDAWVLAKSNVTQAVAIASFAYMCHHSTFLLFGSIKQPTEARWARLTHASVFISALVEIFFAMFGYATFTGFVQGDLMENYCRGDHLMNTAKIMFCITILLTAPIECFVARNLVINTLFRWKKIDSIPSHEEDRLPKVTVTFFLVAATCLISFSTDCLSIVLEFNGIFAAIPLAYILPALCYIQLEPSSWKSRNKLPAILMVVFGVSISLSGLFMIFVYWRDKTSCSHGVEMSYCPIWLNSTKYLH